MSFEALELVYNLFKALLMRFSNSAKGQHTLWLQNKYKTFSILLKTVRTFTESSMQLYANEWY
jgi:hypothetical protein